MQLSPTQMRDFLNTNPHAADLFNMCKESVPTSEFKASLEALLQDAQNMLQGPSIQELLQSRNVTPAGDSR